MPTARLGAPPVRDSSDVSPTLLASAVELRGRDDESPVCDRLRRGLDAVVPSTPAGALIAK